MTDLSIAHFVPPHLKDEFFHGVKGHKDTRHNGLDPYGWSTDGLRLYVPMWSRHTSALTYKSIDPFGHTITRTASGVLHFDGTSNSSITFGVIHNASAKFWFSMNFTPDTITGTQYLLMKDDGGGETLSVYTDGATLKYKAAGSGDDFDLTVGTLVIGTKYHLFVSLSDVNAVIAILNGGSPVTDTSVQGTPNAGALIVGNSAVDADNAFEGEIWGMSCGVADLDAGEKAALNATGALPAVYTESWPADEGSGTGAGAIKDHQPDAPADGTIGSANTWENVPQHQRATGHFFDGFDDYEDTGSSFQSMLKGSFTLVFWMKLDDGRPAEKNVFAGTQKAGATDILEVEVTTAGKLFFYYESNDNFAQAETNAAMYADGAMANFSHVTFVADSTVGGVGGLLIYKEGLVQTLGASDGDTSGITFADFTTSAEVFIGSQDVNSVSATPIVGFIGEVWFYNRVLSAAEIADIYNKTRWRYQ